MSAREKKWGDVTGMGEVGSGKGRGAGSHVALCADAGFAVPLAVALASLNNTAAEEGALAVHIVSSGMSGELRSRVAEAAPRLVVHWYPVDNRLFLGVNNTHHLTDAALYRLLLGEILPGEISRVLYLDADVVVCDDLSPLIHSDLQGMAVGAVRDSVAPWAAGVFGPDWRDLGMDSRSEYFNSGVLLIDLQKWRADGVGRSCIETLRCVKARWGDQDALNLAAEGEWKELPRRWNVQTADLLRDSFSWALAPEEIEAAVTSPGIVHFTAHDKPWKPGSTHPARDLWFAALDHTTWSGWRPKQVAEPDRGLVSQGASAVRAWRRRRRDRAARLPE